MLAIAFVLPVFLVRHVNWPKRWPVRAVTATLLCWVLLIGYTVTVYFPVGIARAEYLGSEESLRALDNNNFVPILLMGWFFPALVLGSIAFWRWFLNNYGEGRKKSTGG